MAKPPEKKARISEVLSAEERTLWRQAIRDAVPLRKDPLPENAGPSQNYMQEKAARPPQRSDKKAPLRANLLAGGKNVSSTSLRPEPPILAHGLSAGLDRRQAARFKRGRLPIEGTLDLHGMTQTRAHQRLSQFVKDASLQGKRCLLIITGKGRDNPEGGVLRQAVPRWLNEPGLRELVISFDYAQQKDGGTGALYLLLRRKRDKLDRGT